MEISVSSRNVDVSASLRSTTEEKVGRLGRFLEGMERAEVRYSEERNPRIANKAVCEVTMQGHGHNVRARATAVDSYAALDVCIERLEQQLTKLKSRLVSRNHGKVRSGGGAAPAAPAASAAEAGEREPRVVKRKQFDLRPMSVDEAVLQMELLGHTFFYFRNADSGLPGVLYQRDDGDIGLIEEAP